MKKIFRTFFMIFINMKVKINDNLFNVKTVITSKDTQNGMMNRKFNDSYDGMLFFMENGPHSFWMKNCVVHLDIIFINDDVITKIHHNCKPCLSDDCNHYEGNGEMVLELQGGDCKKYGIKEGDTISLL
jgi:uncharacterized membrane protein (UPF0127 family)